MSWQRFLVLAGLVFWQGGATFYAAVVVPIGRGLDPAHQSLVTQRVTVVLNLAGSVVVALLTWESLRDADPSPARRRWRRTLGGVIALSLLGMVFVHPRLVELMGTGVLSEERRALLRPWHHLYLALSGVQSLAAWFYLGFTLTAWRAVDQKG